MNRLLASGLGLALTAAALPSFAQTRPAEPRPLFSRPAPATPAATLPAPPAVVATHSPEAMARAIQAERDAYTRRLDVCTQLRRIAASTQDDRLSSRALELEQQAEELYRERIARLGVKSELRTAPPTLDRTLGSGIASTPLTVAPPKPSAPATATAQNRVFREVPPQ